MRRRHTFIKRILPPTAVVALSVSILALGTHDAQQFMNRLQQPQSLAPEHRVSSQPKPSTSWENLATPAANPASVKPAIQGPNPGASAASTVPRLTKSELKTPSISAEKDASSQKEVSTHQQVDESAHPHRSSLVKGDNLLR